MQIIGVTGPMGAGKSTFLQEARQLGGLTLDCDQVYSRLLEEEGGLLDSLRLRFGGAFGPDGRLRREALAGLVFSDPAALAELNRLTHPAVKEAVLAQLEAARRQGVPFAVVEAIALVESGLAQLCHAVVAVLAGRELRLARVMDRTGQSRAQAEQRFAAQQPDAFFLAGCSHVIYNEGDRADFSLRARVLIQSLL